MCQKTLHLKVRRHNPHEEQQLGDRQHGDEQVERRRLFDTQQVDAGEDDVAGQGTIQGSYARVEEMHVCPQGKSDGRRRKYELDQGGIASDDPPIRPQGLERICERTASIRDAGGQFCEAEDERHIEQRDDKGGD